MDSKDRELYRFALRLMKESLEKQEIKKPIKYLSIIQKVADYFNLNIPNILNHNRIAYIADARAIAMYFVYLDLGNYQKTALIFDRNHSSVINAVRKTRDLIHTDKYFRKDVENIKNLLSL